MSSRSKFFVASALTLVAVCSIAREQLNMDAIFFSSDGNPKSEVHRASERARARLDDVLAKMKLPPPSISSFSLLIDIGESQAKRYFDGQIATKRYFWVSNFEGSGDKFVGEINIQLQMNAQSRRVQVAFSRAQVVDWAYFDTETQTRFGNFIECALLSKASPAQFETERKRYGLSCNET